MLIEITNQRMWQNPRSNLKGTFVYFLPSVPPIKSIYSPPRCKLRCLHWFSLKSCSNVLRFAKLKDCFHWSFSYYKAVRWTLSFWKRNIIKTKRAGMTLNKRSRRLTKASPWEIRDTNNCNLLTVNSRYNATFIFGFWQGLAIKKSVELSWPNYVYKYWSRFFIQTSHRAIWLSLHMWAYAPQPNNSDKLWRSLKLCFSRKFACCLTYPLSSVWPELSDLSSALILHGFHYYNLEWRRKARNVLSKHNASLRTVTVVQNECFSPRICPPCQYTFSEITLISAFCPFFDGTAATRSNPWRITLSHHITITSALFLPKPFSPRERSWFANGVLDIREIDGACHVFQLVYPPNDVERLYHVIKIILHLHFDISSVFFTWLLF